MPRLVLENVSKRYGAFEAVPEINLAIDDGDFTILVGPSGCGKSTVLRMIAGLETPTRGRILLDDVDITVRAPKDRNIAMVFQDYALYPHMSVRQNMAFSLSLRKTPKPAIEAAVKAAAKILGIDGLLDRRPSELSGGQRQRVALGRALVRKPQLFLFDEPLSNLDAALRGGMRVELTRLHHRLKTTSVYVTHDQIEAMTMGSKIVVMRDGLVNQIGNPLDVFNAPVNLFVAGFIGSPKMNLLEAKLLKTEDGMVADLGDFQIVLPRERNAAYADHAGKDVVLGIRPTDIALQKPGDGPEASVSVNIELAEPLGVDTHLYCRKGSIEFLAAEARQVQLEPGSAANLTFNLARSHLFERTPEGKRIDAGTPEGASVLHTKPDSSRGRNARKLHNE
jgi:multiple sugar transport system ATP-binding protein